ncbi:hypothetical protein JTE90_015266 [Oedothorax gibbosus]|uniref:GYF domain-containing protein n=1 Tax=Oedothorax gibbosus TaxID=931172 RepID=A0AAV6UEG3_9ARAC|nr:hypothetical protein JTE90_015266 [Oedothorax gibbosus]
MNSFASVRSNSHLKKRFIYIASEISCKVALEMAETALNFGPDWIRALASGSQGAEAAPPTMSVPRYKLAEHRYGREEMLGLIPKHPRAPESLKQFEHLAKQNFQIPLALTPMTEEEQYLWTSRYLNSEASLRGKTGPGGYGMNRTGRGGSVDRGRGRGRGGYYQRGMLHDDLPEGPPFPRQKTIERSLSANEKEHRWDERDRRYDRTYSGRIGNDDTYLKQDNTRGPHEHWRKYDDEGDWRSGGSRSYDKLAGRGSWRSERDRRDPLDHRNPPPNRGNTRGGASPQQRIGSHSSWKEDSQGHLPEWSVEEVAEPDTVGTFDSSGAFLETKVSEENTTQDEVYVSDDADEGSANQDSPEAKKESSKKTPKKPANKPSANTKKNSKSTNEAKNLEETGLEETSTPPKSTPKGARGKSKEKQQSPEPKTSQKKETSPVKQIPKSTNPVKTLSKADAVDSGDPKKLENASTTEDDAFAYHQKATENMVAQWTEEIEQRVTPHTEESSAQQDKDSKWFYQDPQGEIQGPFASHEMLEWFSSGYFTMSLMVRRSCDETFAQLGDLIKSCGRVPFMPGTPPPPIRASALPSSLTAPMAPAITPNIPAAPPGGQIPKPDEQLLQLQQQLLQQQLMQQQLMLRQAHMQQLLTQLKTQDNFTHLTSQQQQQVLMQQFMAQIPSSGLKPMGDPSNLMNPMSALAHPLMGLPLPPMMKSDLWQTAPETGPWPVNVNTPQPPGGSIWDTDLSKSNEPSELEKQKLAEEQEKIRKSEELRLQQERELEEQRNREELRRQQEEEEERKRIEEIRRQEAERQLKQELKRLEEQRLREEEAERQRQQQEEIRRRKLEEEKRIREEEELRKLEEHRRKEEERRQQEEAKRLAEMKKAEEKRKKEEIQKQKEQEKLLEVERQRELLRQKEAEREKMLLREKREREEAELRKLAELKIKTQGPVWGIQKSQSSSDAPLSLADIQRIQEEKEREEREEKMRQQQLQQHAVKQVQVVKNGLTWAKRANDCPSVVKSLSEIQQEEAERLAQLSRMQKPQAPAPPVNSNAGVWGNSSHLNKITASPSGWNVGNHSMTGGFWDDALSTTQPKKQPTPKSSDNAFPSLVVPAKPAANNKSKNARAKKDEDAVSRLFGSHHKPTDEFTKWCTDAISAMPSSVDVPTFVAFLKDIESPYEVYDYVKSYFGEGKEPREFAKLFLEKRSKYRNQAKQAPTEDNSLWGPAPAITPTVNKPPAPPNNDNDFVVKGKSKKKKGKMQRLDASMLGFTVQPSPDRVNAGEIDHVDHNV